jgi:hypothetical protein
VKRIALDADKTRINVKLKFALPLLQVGLAFGLLAWDRIWEMIMPTQDMPEPSLALKLLVSINAPVLVPGAFLLPRLPRLPNSWTDITLLVAIGLLWYWVALNILSWEARRSVCMSSMLPLRLIGDILPISVGVFLIFACWQDLFRNFVPISWSYWLRFDPFVGAVVAWSVVLVSFFGWDFIHCILRRRSRGGYGTGLERAT